MLVTVVLPFVLRLFQVRERLREQLDFAPHGNLFFIRGGDQCSKLT
jgi:hypothetical protein